MSGQEFFELGIFMGGETQVSFLGAFPTPDFSLCLSKQISIEVNMLLPGLNGCLSRMRLRLVSKLRETPKENGSTVTISRD